MDTAKELQDAGSPPALQWLAPKSTKLGSYCAPDADAAPKPIRDTYNALRSSSGASVVASIYAAGTPILITMVFAVVVGFLWLKLMQKCVGVLTYAAILGILLGFVFTWISMLTKALTACDQPNYEPNCNANKTQ